MNPEFDSSKKYDVYTDRKGRLDGFEPHTRYMRDESKAGVVSFYRQGPHYELLESERQVPRLPNIAWEYLTEHDLDPRDIQDDGQIDEGGYNERQYNPDGTRKGAGGRYITKRKDWPEGFNWRIFVTLVRTGLKDKDD